MEIKVILFPNNLTLIAQIEEVVPEEIGQPDCKIIEPFVISDDYLQPWLIDVSTQNAFMMHSDKFLTLADPNINLLAKYKELIK
jgi:hypothetical protein